MKQINQFINEYIVKKKLDKPINSENYYKYFPKTKEELIKNIQELINKDIYDFNCIDTSEITDMSKLFRNEVFEKINFNVSDWDVSNVENMDRMFIDCEKFDCDLSNWNVSNVMYMDSMFEYCYKFTGKGLENWDVSNVTNMMRMFFQCTNLDCDLSKWDVRKSDNLINMFKGCSKFKGKGLENWNVTDGTKIYNMFAECNLIKKYPDWYIKLTK